MIAINTASWPIRTHIAMRINVAIARTPWRKTKNHAMPNTRDAHRERFNADRVEFVLAGILYAMEDQIAQMAQMKSVI